MEENAEQITSHALDKRTAGQRLIALRQIARRVSAPLGEEIMIRDQELMENAWAFPSAEMLRPKGS